MRYATTEYHSALKKKKLTIDKNTDEPGAQGNKPDKKAEDSRFHSCEESEAVRPGDGEQRGLPSRRGAGRCCLEGGGFVSTLETRGPVPQLPPR